MCKSYPEQITILAAYVGFRLLPNSPTTCNFLSPREKYIAMERVRRESPVSTAADTKMVLRHVLKRGVFNWNNNLCAAGFFLGNTAVQSISLFLVCLNFFKISRNPLVLIIRISIANYSQGLGLDSHPGSGMYIYNRPVQCCLGL